MKNKLIGFALISAMACGTASAVSLTTTLIANTANNVGLITTLVGGVQVNVTGFAYIYATSTELSAAQTAGISTREGFESLLVNDPGVVRANILVTNGAVTSSGPSELGAVGNKVYVFFNSADTLSYGAYQGANVPALGAVTLNSNTITEDLIGTSAYNAVGTSGFQLSFIPEPSTALLGAVGALGLLRRRRN